MKEILVRGKLFGQNWIYGSLVAISGRCYISTEESEFNSFVSAELDGPAYHDFINEMIEVHPKTVGQFTGKLDEVDTEIFQGDRLYMYFNDFVRNAHISMDMDEDTEGVVIWDDATCSFLVQVGAMEECFSFNELNNVDLRVIGNIHDECSGNLSY